MFFNLENSIDYARYVPEDVLKEIIEYEEKSRVKHSRKKRAYPSSRDIVEAVIEASSQACSIHPDEFPDMVFRILEEKGFSTRYVTVKRIWRTYEMLVKRGVLRDVLNVTTSKRRDNSYE